MMLVKNTDPILREQMPEFDFENPITDPVQLEKELLEFMYVNGGMGLAANQVGIRTRVFVMGHRGLTETGEAFFNPKIIAHTDMLDDLPEGCLSFPNIYVKVKRPTHIKAQWQKSSGEIVESTLSGYDCKCFLHELDHLEGITFQDRVSPLKWVMAFKKSRRK